MLSMSIMFRPPTSCLLPCRLQVKSNLVMSLTALDALNLKILSNTNVTVNQVSAPLPHAGCRLCYEFLRIICK